MSIAETIAQRLRARLFAQVRLRTAALGRETMLRLFGFETHEVNVPRPARLVLFAASLVLIAASLVMMPPASAATARNALPEIRTSSANRVPSCVTPDRLMAFLSTRNRTVAARYRDIARWYRHHGDTWRVRWDFAFFQMVLETNFLSYRRPDGRPGDVAPAQNNFAGIGATGGGVPGDRFADIGTGVLAQIQHLVAYSGERLEKPVAPRTRLKQGDIVEVSRKLRRPVRFSDLARRWAADPRYAASIANIADSYYQDYCARRDAAVTPSGSTNKRNVLAATKSYLIGSSADPVTLTAEQPIPPAPSSAAKARGRVVARTVWQRGQPVAAATAVEPQDGSSRENTPIAAPARPLVKVEHVIVVGEERHGLLNGLQGIAQNMLSRPISPPAPRIALREPR